MDLCARDISVKRVGHTVPPHVYYMRISVVTTAPRLRLNMYVPPALPQIIVPTTDGVRNTYLLDLLLRGGKHTLTCGPTGTGKTVNIAQYLMGQSTVAGRLDTRRLRPITEILRVYVVGSIRLLYDPPSASLYEPPSV